MAIIQIMTLTRASQSSANIAHAIFINVSLVSWGMILFLDALRRAREWTIGSWGGELPTARWWRSIVA